MFAQIAIAPLALVGCALLERAECEQLLRRVARAG